MVGAPGYLLKLYLRIQIFGGYRLCQMIDVPFRNFDLEIQAMFSEQTFYDVLSGEGDGLALTKRR